MGHSLIDLTGKVNHVCSKNVIRSLFATVNLLVVLSSFHLLSKSRWQISTITSIKTWECRWLMMLKICPNLTWDLEQQSRWKQLRSSANRSIFEINSLGERKLQLLIHSYTKNGKEKHQGGDYWRFVIVEPYREALSVIDIGNGSYSVELPLRRAGTFKVEGTLVYSLCEGLKDPPEFWFRSGNIHGHYQPDNILGYWDDYLEEDIEPIVFNSNMYFKERQYGLPSNLGEQSCSSNGCPIVWRGTGFWESNNWVPLTAEDRQAMKEPAKKNGSLNALWLYGDSIAFNLHRSIQRHPLCKSLYRECKLTYTWTYPIKDHKKEANLHEGKDFNITRFLLPVKNILHNPAMTKKYSTFLVNFGLHQVLSITFSEFQKLIHTFISLVQDSKRRFGNDHPRILWKTLTPPYLKFHKYRGKDHVRFLTEQRTELFDSYSKYMLCNENIEIIDIHHMAASRRDKILDFVHFADQVFRPVENVLYNLN